MNLQEQVVSLALAKQLKEAGIKQESLFYWVGTIWMPEVHLVIAESLDTVSGLGENCTEGSVYIDSGHEGEYWSVREIYSAFTVAELGELTKGVTESYFNLNFGKWACGMRDTEDHCPIFFEMTEADARAKMLISNTQGEKRK